MLDSSRFGGIRFPFANLRNHSSTFSGMTVVVWTGATGTTKVVQVTTNNSLYQHLLSSSLSSQFKFIINVHVDNSYNVDASPSVQSSPVVVPTDPTNLYTQCHQQNTNNAQTKPRYRERACRCTRTIEWTESDR